MFLTGYCTRGNGCRFLHDDRKRAICREFLRKGTCTGRCFLSHEPTAHNTPPCNFFSRGMCTNESCRYAHVKVSKDAPVCYQFGELGYCDKGSKCPDYHAYECPSFSNTGQCSAKKCRLRHIAMARGNSKSGNPVSSGESHAVSDDKEQTYLDEKAKSGNGEGADRDEEMTDVDVEDSDKYMAHRVNSLSSQEDFIPLGVDN